MTAGLRTVITAIAVAFAGVAVVCAQCIVAVLCVVRAVAVLRVVCVVCVVRVVVHVTTTMFDIESSIFFKSLRRLETIS